MVDNQHKKISGYRDLTEEEISLMNDIKGMEIEVAQLWKEVFSEAGVDKRWAAVARTHFQEGFSALIRSIAKPVDPFDNN